MSDNWEELKQLAKEKRERQELLKIQEAKKLEELKKSDKYPDGSFKTYFPGKPWLNKYGYPHATERCIECGQWECDPEGIGHYRG